MLLLVDAGNTRVKWALAGPDASLGSWVASGAVMRAELDSLGDAWRAQGFTHALVSNVAGEAMRNALERLLTQAGVASIEWFSSSGQCGGVINRYRRPAQLGCDRFAAAIGAHALYPGQPLIVATCGTATTIDALTAEGVFLGGMILPGLQLMAAALARNTAQLPQVAQAGAAVTPFADNTDDAIVSGCIAAQTGAIEHAVTAHAGRHDAVTCLISGGAAGWIAPHLSVPCTRVDNLVLTGLQVVMKQNQPC